MCRWAAWSGVPIRIEEMVTAGSNSLIMQSHDAQECKTRINADGFGLAWYAELPEPGLYRDVLPAWSDCNLRSLAGQIRSGLFMAHVRASSGTATSRQNCHPFVSGPWSFMHNGQIGQFELLRRGLEARLADAGFARRLGTTDSELFFLLMLQNGIESDVRGAICETLKSIEAEGSALGMKPLIRLTAAFSDGETLYAVRHSNDGHCPSLYGRTEPGRGICLVSEPLDRQSAGWEPVPPESFVTIRQGTMEVAPFQAPGALAA